MSVDQSELRRPGKGTALVRHDPLDVRPRTPRRPVVRDALAAAWWWGCFTAALSFAVTLDALRIQPARAV